MTDKSFHTQGTQVGIRYQDDTDPQVIVFLERLLERSSQDLNRMFELVRKFKSVKCFCTFGNQSDCQYHLIQEEIALLCVGK